MFVQQDWLMRQIEMMLDAIAQLLAGREERGCGAKDGFGQEGAAGLQQKLTCLLEKRKLDEAENLLFFALEDGDDSALAAALDFYQKANAMSDRELEEQNFTRAELLRGLDDIAERFGLLLPGGSGEES